MAPSKHNEHHRQELSWLYWLTFDGLRAATDIDIPTLFVHSDDCVLWENVRALAKQIVGAELEWGAGSQIDFYNRDPQVSFAVKAADRHFRAHLRSRP